MSGSPPPGWDKSQWGWTPLSCTPLQFPYLNHSKVVTQSLCNPHGGVFHQVSSGQRSPHELKPNLHYHADRTEQLHHSRFQHGTPHHCSSASVMACSLHLSLLQCNQTRSSRHKNTTLSKYIFKGRSKALTLDPRSTGPLFPCHESGSQGYIPGVNVLLAHSACSAYLKAVESWPRSCAAVCSCVYAQLPTSTASKGSEHKQPAETTQYG